MRKKPQLQSLKDEVAEIERIMDILTDLYGKGYAAHAMQGYFDVMRAAQQNPLEEA